MEGNLPGVSGLCIGDPGGETYETVATIIELLFGPLG